MYWRNNVIDGERNRVGDQEQTISGLWRFLSPQHPGCATKRPLTVAKIVETTGLSQSNASNHLGCLRDCGLVVSEQNGRYVSYRLSDDRVGDMLTLAEALLADVARGVYECTRYNQ